MLDFIFTLLQDLLPLVVHFPVALFTLSFIFALLARFKPKLGEVEWPLLVIATAIAPIAVITGFIAHLPYVDSSLITVIDPHKFSAMIGTIVMIAVTAWRAVSRRNGKDIGQSRAYMLFALLGLVWIVFTGGTGGQLVYNYAINVRCPNLLLP